MKNIVLFTACLCMSACEGSHDTSKIENEIADTDRLELKEIDSLKPPCNVDPNSIIRISNPDLSTIMGHSRSNYGDTLISVFSPFYWRLNSNQQDTLAIELQVPVGFQLDSVMTSYIPSGANCNNDLKVFDFRFHESVQAQSLQTITFKWLVSHSEWQNMDYYLITFNGRKKKAVAANADVQPEFDNSKH